MCQRVLLALGVVLCETAAAAAADLQACVQHPVLMGDQQKVLVRTAHCCERFCSSSSRAVRAGQSNKCCTQQAWRRQLLWPASCPVPITVWLYICVHVELAIVASAALARSGTAAAAWCKQCAHTHCWCRAAFALLLVRRVWRCMYWVLFRFVIWDMVRSSSSSRSILA
jgi:hypothetical protein